MDDQTLHHFMEDLLPLVVITTMVICGAWIISLMIAAFKNRAHLKAQTDFHNRMLEKFSSADEFAVYMQSDAGKSFFDNLTNEPITPINKIFGSIQKGAILTLLGIGLFVLGKTYTPQEGGNIMFVVGIISLMIGTGFLISSVISYRLAKTLGIIPLDKKQTPTTTTGQSSATTV
jgi:hypothetical protein